MNHILLHSVLKTHMQYEQHLSTRTSIGYFGFAKVILPIQSVSQSVSV